MRKNIIGALIASAFAVSGTAHAGLTFDLNGAADGGLIQADAFDWSQTSFLARGGNTAIAAFASSGGACPNNSCSFEVLTHAIMTTYTPTGGGAPVSAQGFGQITMVGRYTEQVVGFSTAGLPQAVFASTGVGSVEFYYTPAANANDLTGNGFNSGRLIGRLTGNTANAVGSFLVTSTGATPGAGFLLDQTSDGNQYGDQRTVNGFGSQETIFFGLGGVELDPTFFLTTIAEFSLNFTNISIGLPYTSVNPSDCFNDPIAGRAVGTGGYASTCDNEHVNGLMSAQGGPGYIPNIGLVNGLNLGSPDFIAQTDFNSAVRGVPEPGSLALTGLALAALGVAASRRRRA